MARTTACAWVVLVIGWATVAHSAPAHETVQVDLNPLIDAAAKSPEQFAVNISHGTSSAANGTWNRQGTTSTWLYSVRIPSAISMSFHASEVRLPPSAVLTVSTSRASVGYRARDVTRSGLWGRPMPGDTLNFSLSVSSAEAGKVRLQIESLQAGYRSLGGGVPDHPHYAAIRRAAATSTSGCTENYSCHVTAGNQGASQATVALLVSNLYQCTGTLLNDTSTDGTPYVLTARHCETGELGGGDPAAAATVTVLWDTVSPCAGDLGSIYDASTPGQTGATTMLEQQDIWLLHLDAPPVASDAYYAGWDASGTSFTGGYNINDALGEDQQYVGWNGTGILEQIPGATLGISYDSTFWGVVNAVGSLGAGASGSGLFSPANQVVGSASLGVLTPGENSAGICPAASPATPAPASVTALFTALSGVWTSAADRTSSTGSRTLKSFLDPQSTGQLTTTGIGTEPITLTTSASSSNTGSPVTLSWSAPGAQSCMASGGMPGDDWSGVQPASGSLQLTSQQGGTIDYSIFCVIAGQLGSGTVAVAWDYIAPTTGLSGGPVYPSSVGSTRNISWAADVEPCTATGGVSGDGWAGPQPLSGTYQVTVTQPGITQYTLTCGPAQRSASDSIEFDGVYPAVTLVSNVTEVNLGQSFDLNWFGNSTGASCVPSGGSGSDSWTASTVPLASNGSTSVTESGTGTYTFTLTCSDDGHSNAANVTVAVVSEAPAVSLTAVAPQQQVYTLAVGSSAPPALNLLWSSTVNGCAIDYTSNTGQSQAIVLTESGASGAVSDSETQPGLVTYTLECGTQTVSTSINWVTTAAPSLLSVASPSWAAGVPYAVSWNAASGPCIGGGGTAGDGWAGTKTASGSQSITESQSGTYVFSLACGSGSAATTSEVAVTVPLPYVSINTTPGSTSGSVPFTTVSWQSTVGPCTYLDGSKSGAVPVAVDPSGSTISTPPESGIYVFALSCGNGTGGLSTATVAQVTVSEPPTLSASATSVAISAPVTLTWNSSGYGICIATGGDALVPWVGTLPGAGSLVVTSSSAGTLTYGLTCGGQMAQVAVTYSTVPASAASALTPTATLTASTATLTVGQSISLTWKSTNADTCSATGGETGDGWTGTLAASGSMTVAESVAGTVTYSVTCAGAPPAAVASTTVTFKDMSAVTVTSSSSKSGGGGSMDLLFLLVLCVPVMRRHRTSYAP
jgi:hypothetical protein